MDTDLREHLDRSFGDGPAHRPVGTSLVAGRRSLLGRRLATGAASLAVVALVGTSYAVASGGGGQAIRPGFATSSPTPDSGLEPTTAREKEQRPRWQGQFVRYDGDEVELRPGATVLRRIPDPAQLEPPDTSTALVVRWRGTDYWMLLTREAGAESSAYTPAAPGRGWATFEDWVADQVAVNASPVASASPVAFDDAGRLVAAAGFEVVEQRPGVDLGEGFAPPGATTAVALVKSASDRTWWVARVLDGEPDYLPAPVEPGQDMDDFIASARDAYSGDDGSREGLR